MGDAAATPAPQVKRPRVFYGWYIVAASIVTNALTTAAYFQGFQAFFLPILNTFGWSRTAISGAFSFRSLESGFVGPIAGFLADRVGPRRLILAGSIIIGLGLIGLSQTRNLFMFYLFFILISVGTAGATHGISWPILVARWFRRQRGRAMGIALSGPIIGGLFVVPNAALIAEFGWRPVLFVYGIVVMVGVFLMGLVARDRPEHLGLLPDGDMPKEPAALPQGKGAQGRRASSPANPELGMRAGQILRSRDFWVLILFLGAASIGNSAFSVHQLPYFQSVGFSSGAAAATVALVVLFSGVGRMGGGVLADFLDYRIILVMTALLMSLSYFYLAVVPISSLATALPFVAMFGISFGSAIPLRPFLGSLLFGTRSLGVVIGLLQAGTVAEGAIGPIFMGYIFDQTGSYDRALWVLGFLPLIPIPLLLLMKPRSKLRQWAPH